MRPSPPGTAAQVDTRAHPCLTPPEPGGIEISWPWTRHRVTRSASPRIFSRAASGRAFLCRNVTTPPEVTYVPKCPAGARRSHTNETGGHGAEKTPRLRRRRCVGASVPCAEASQRSSDPACLHVVLARGTVPPPPSSGVAWLLRSARVKKEPGDDVTATPATRPPSLNTRRAEPPSVPPSIIFLVLWKGGFASKVVATQRRGRRDRVGAGLNKAEEELAAAVVGEERMGRGGGGGGRVEAGAGCRCELCGAPAAVHCEADAAFLCAACDAKVHGANFLASRHLRTRILSPAAAPEADPEEDDDGYASAASSCVSTADSASTAAAARRRRHGVDRGRARAAGRTPARARAEAVLEGWAKRMGLSPGAARRRAAAASRALRACGADLAAAAARVPPRVAMAAALWSEVAAAGGGGGGDDDDVLLRRLEACAHVPARVVVAVATSMARVRARRRAAVEEGWDECAWAGPKSNPARS
ncbi:hypothetical protein HU200_042925 [Digitaria exilis]|uniref:B box-type domain-containing protein n=1 Tax=Digitaria exilis TaxID=1010633 RepID=A0A835BF13_9POAL|nr:hypothetical protein HU200_042925 [Digitaria exilis]